MAVSRSRHPGLNTYIKETVFSLKPWIVQKKLEKLTLVFCEDGSDKVIERLVFSVKVLREIEGRKPEGARTGLRGPGCLVRGHLRGVESA